MHINLLKNLPLKIASLLLAFVIWLLIMNVSDPVDWITVNGIQVTVLNENYLEEKQGDKRDPRLGGCEYG